MEIELRDGSQHSQSGFIPFLARVLHKGLELTAAPLLVRCDSAHDAWDTRIELSSYERVDYIIKWNPRKQNLNYWANFVFSEGVVSIPCPGKRVAVMSVSEKHTYKTDEGIEKTITCRRVVRVIERTIDKKGQLLLAPDIELEGWWTSLDLVDQKIIELYEHHGKSEQFHSELKTDTPSLRQVRHQSAHNVVCCACLQHSSLHRATWSSGRKDAG